MYMSMRKQIAERLWYERENVGEVDDVLKKLIKYRKKSNINQLKSGR